MQVNTNNIQRSTLFSDFFGLELIWSNEYLTYIQTSINSVTSSLCKTAKSTTHNIKKSLNRASLLFYIYIVDFSSLLNYILENGNQLPEAKKKTKNMIRFIKNLNQRVNSHKEMTKCK